MSPLPQNPVDFIVCIKSDLSRDVTGYAKPGANIYTPSIGIRTKIPSEMEVAPRYNC